MNIEERERHRADLEERTSEIAPAIGRYAIAFGEIESTVDYALSEMISMFSRDFGKIFVKGLNFNSKKKIFKNLVDWRIRNDKLLVDKEEAFALYDELISDLEKISKNRNLILHAHWTWWKPKEPVFNAFERKSVKDLDDETDQLWSVFSKLEYFIFDLLHVDMVGGPMPGVGDAPPRGILSE